MEGNERRKKIVQCLKCREKPVSGNDFAKILGVSRQVIVQDIALLRANHINILSTTKGYVYYVKDNNKPKRVFMVAHSNEQIEDELNTIVDCGGKVMDVVVEHDIYGSISVDLVINNRCDVRDFIDKVANEKTVPLMGLTKGTHYHTVEAENEEVLDRIEKELRVKGYLIQR